MGTKGLAGLVLVAALLVGASGCGGDEDTTITTADYRTKATAICEQTQETLDELEKELDPKDPKAPAEFVQQFAVEVLDQFAQLRELGLPDKGRAELEQAYTTFEKRLTVWKNDPSLATQPKLIEEMQAAAKTLDKYGVGACGVGI